MNFDKFKSKYSKKKKAVVMGNGPSLNQYDWHKISSKNKDIIFLACNRISNIFSKEAPAWRPNIYTCFTSTSLTEASWKKSIDFCLQDDKIDSFIFDAYRSISSIKNFHDGVYFCNKVAEHNRHQPIQNNFIDIPLTEYFLKSYSATVTLFQICNWLNIEKIFIIGQDGYTNARGQNHYNNTYGFEPNDFKKSNDRIASLHKELSRFFKMKNVHVYNTSNNSILQSIYEYQDLNLL